MTYARLQPPKRAHAENIGSPKAAKRPPARAPQTPGRGAQGGPSGAALWGALGPQSTQNIAVSGLSGQPVALPFIEKLQAASGTHSLRSVKAYVGRAASHANEQLGSSAFTIGESIAFARPPSLWMAAHEAAHVVQQRAGAGAGPSIGRRDDAQERQADEVADRVSRGVSAAPLLDRIARPDSPVTSAGQGRRLQFYCEEQRVDGKTWRISDDMKMALRTEEGAEPNRHLYATSELLTRTKMVMTRQGSSISLAASPGDAFSLGENRLRRVIPTNSNAGGKSSGNDPTSGMDLIPECGYAANTVMQGKGLRFSGVYQKRRQGTPAFGAYEFTGGAGLSQAANWTEKQTDNYDYKEDYGIGGALKAPEMAVGDALIDTFGGDYFSATRAYQAIHKSGLPEGEPGFEERMRGQTRATSYIDSRLKINRDAQPDVGEAYVIVNDPLDEFPADPNNLPFNFHWAAVILRSGGDTVTLENATGSTAKDWYYAMYGPAAKDGQTFHEQQSLTQVSADTGLFGENPITVRIRPEAAGGTGRRFPGPYGVR